MPVLHISLFDYRAFLSEADPLIREIDAGDYESLRSHVRASVSRYSGVCEGDVDRTAPICIHGGVLPARGSIDEPVPSPRMVGEWILAVIDQFLEMPVSLTRGASLGPILERIGWRSHSIHRLLHGRPMGQLLKPALVEEEPKFVSDTDPYWLWLRLHGATVGWLNDDGVERLLHDLNRDREQIAALDVRHVPGIDHDDQLAQHEYSQRIQRKCDFMLERLTKARKRQLGLLQSTVYYC